MKSSSYKINVSESIGSVSAELTLPEELKCVLTLAHGAGAGMNHSFMKELSLALSMRGCGSLRFNFPYMEKGSKRPDVPAVATKTIKAAIEFLSKECQSVPMFASGKSFGGRMTSQYLSSENSSTVKGIIFFGFPLHPAGEPGVMRAEHLHSVNSPMLFLQGTKDALAQNDLITSVMQQLTEATLVMFEGADHSFKVGKRIIINELADACVQWIERIITKGNQQ